MSSAVAKIAKPVMRGHLMKQIKFHLVAATVLSCITTSAFYYFVPYKRRQVYTEFYKTYDPDEDYERMKATGNVFKNI